jgi:hypothetical protein
MGLSLMILLFFDESNYLAFSFSYKVIESFAYPAIRGFTGIYILTVGILYVPHSLKAEKSNGEGDASKGEADKMQ